MKTQIKVIQTPETKTKKINGRTFLITYPNGYPITVRRVSHCSNCGVEIGGYFGNGVYRYQGTDLCVPCGEIDDPIVKLCISQTGMTPSEYQRKNKRAWNE